MKRMMLLSAPVALVLVLALLTTQAAADQPSAPGGTPGPPNKGSASTGTVEPIPILGSPPHPGSQNTPGARATGNASLHRKPGIYNGILNALDAASLTLTLDDGSSITFRLTPDTRIKVPGPRAQGDTLLVGMHIVVQAVTDASGSLVARSVMAVPGQPTLAHRVGTVTAYAPGASITVLAVDGSTYAFALTSDTKILPRELALTLAVDSRVTVIAPRDVSTLGWTAIGLVVHPSPR
jgi:hypothetical protein